MSNRLNLQPERTSSLGYDSTRVNDHEVVTEISRGLNQRALAKFVIPPEDVNTQPFSFAIGRRRSRRPMANDLRNASIPGVASGSLEAHHTYPRLIS